MRHLTPRALPIVILLAACATAPPGATGPAATGGAIPRSAAEANVIKGRVADAQDRPVAGVVLRVSGYSADGGSHDDNLTTDASGQYRQPVEHGLYEVIGRAPLSFDGGDYVFDLLPVDGACDEADSSEGIVEDFRLSLTGLKVCEGYKDPQNPGSYLGAAVELLYVSPRALPDDTDVTLTLTPDGPLADGTTGTPVVFSRTVAELQTGFGPLDGTSSLYDIPLAAYQISGDATLPDGSTESFRFRLPAVIAGSTAQPVDSLDLRFERYAMEPFGIRSLRVDVFDEAWSEE
jgi:hypothetical protein